MGRPKKSERTEDTVELLLAAAEKRFGAQGFHETSLSDVAADARIGAPSLLYHFASKDALFDAILERFYRDLAAALDEILADDRAAPEIVTMALSAVTAFHRRKGDGIVRVMVSELLGPAGRGKAVVARHAPVLLDRIEAAIRTKTVPKIPDEAPVRQVILHVLMGHLARVAHGELAAPLWGEPDRSAQIAAVLFRDLQGWGER